MSRLTVFGSDESDGTGTVVGLVPVFCGRKGATAAATEALSMAALRVDAQRFADAADGGLSSV